MKQPILIFILSLSFLSSVFSQTKEEYYEKASDFYDKSDYTKSIDNINKALDLDSTNGRYLRLKGNTLVKAKRFLEAFDTYSTAIKFNPKDAVAYNQRGLLLMTMQEEEQSINDFSDALKFEKTDSIRLSLYLNRGAAKINIRNFQGAYDDFRSALALDSLSIGVLNNLASVCDEIGKGDQTLGYLYKILKLDSTFIGAYENIGFKYQEMGDYKTAITFFNKVLELDQNEPLAYSNRSFNRYKLGDLELALSDINVSIKLYPANSYAYRIRALIYLALKDTQKACPDIAEALRLGFTKMYGSEVEQLKKDYCKQSQ
jgi:tetratricopeptide (TPR) repeat protein